MSKFYVVWKGRNIGIFKTWSECEKQVKGFSNARFKSFASKAEAEKAFKISNTESSQRTESSKIKKSRDKKSFSTSSMPELTQADIDAQKHEFKIFSDGSSVPNPGECASGLAILKNNHVFELQYGLYEREGTNNVAELKALYAAMHQASMFYEKGHSCAIYTDSSYAFKSMVEWGARWKKNGWIKKGSKNSKAEPVSNLDLIQPMYEFYVSNIKNKIALYWVRGHSKILGNELCDRLSVIGRQECEPDLRIYPFTSVAEILAIKADREANTM